MKLVLTLVTGHATWVPSWTPPSQRCPRTRVSSKTSRNWSNRKSKESSWCFIGTIKSLSTLDFLKASRKDALPEERWLCRKHQQPPKLLDSHSLWWNGKNVHCRLDPQSWWPKISYPRVGIRCLATTFSIFCFLTDPSVRLSANQSLLQLTRRPSCWLPRCQTHSIGETSAACHTSLLSGKKSLLLSTKVFKRWLNMRRFYLKKSRKLRILLRICFNGTQWGSSQNQDFEPETKRLLDPRHCWMFAVLSR